MRIISGKYKGRRYQGKIPPGVRPTSDMARESVFNTIRNYTDIDQAVVMDVCAGAGALGIESISRGADSCIFIDKSRKSADYIKSSLDYFGVDKSQYQILIKAAEKSIPFIKESYPDYQADIVFIDPPYAANIINGILEDFVKFDSLSEEGIIVAEYSAAGGIVIPEKMVSVKQRQFGETKFDFITWAN
jgi:16S rRNA (guanine(966)-N(2))-methyltransferase RsmD